MQVSNILSTLPMSEDFPRLDQNDLNRLLPPTNEADLNDKAGDDLPPVWEAAVLIWIYYYTRWHPGTFPVLLRSPQLSKDRMQSPAFLPSYEAQGILFYYYYYFIQACPFLFGKSVPFLNHLFFPHCI